ncbi:YhdP family protein [Colwelliaceae bacterium BS250]
MKIVRSYANIWLSRLYKTLAVLLVLFAVLLSSLKIFLPYADSYTQDLEAYINESYQGTVEIGLLTAGWQNFGPKLVVQNVILSDSAAVSITIDEIDVGFDFWGSLKQQKIKANNFTLIGTEITIDQGLLAEAAQTNDTETANNLDDISDLLLQQVKRFSVVNSKVVVITPFKTRTFIINKLAWLNDDDRHQGIGQIYIEGISADTAKLVVDLKGSTLNELNGQIYVEGTNINLAGWLEKYLDEKHDQIDSSVNLQSWLTIENGHNRGMEINIEESTVSWSSFDQQHQLTLQNAQFSIIREGLSQNYFVQSSPLEFDFNDQPWTEFYVQAKYSEQDIQTYISNISVDNVWQVFPLLSENIAELVDFSPLQATGDLADIHFKKNADGVLAKLDLKDLSWHYANNIPGLEHVNGELLYSNNKVQLEITSKSNHIDFNKHFSRPIPFNDLKAKVNLGWNEQQWTLAVSNIGLSSDELALTGEVQYKQVVDQVGELGIFAFVSRADASKAQYYLPLSIMSASLVDYLNGAIHAGRGTQVAVLLNGPVSSFPFKDNSGIFVVDADLEQANYQFEQSWPAITDAEVNLNFTNDSMLITASDGDLTGIKTAGVVVGIESLSGDAILTVRSPVNANVSAVQDLMMASPMAGSVGEILEFIGPSGDITGTFSLDLPLDDTDKAVAAGVVNLNNNKVNLTAPEMDFDRVNGQLSFTNEKITTDNLTLFWRGLPIALDVNGDKENEHYSLGIDLLGNWQKSHYLAQIPQQLQSYLDGQLDWQGKLTMKIPDSGDFSYKVKLDSQLENAELLLPQPYSKPIGDKIALSASVNGDKDQSIIEATLGDKLHFYGDLDHQQTTFVRSHLVLGNEKMLLPISGFHITTGLKNIVYQQWHELVFNIIDSLPDADSENVNSATTDQPSISLMAPPERIRGSLFSVDFYGQKLTDVSFNLLNKKNSWLLQLNADQVRSRFKFYHDFADKGLEIDADFIHLLNETTNNTDSEADSLKEESQQVVESSLLPSDIPNTKFFCKSCKYNDLNLGSVKFELAKSNKDSVSLLDFKATRKDNELNLMGEWRKNNSINTTNISGSYSTKDVETEVKAFGFESGIKDSGITSSFNIDWQGDPQQFNLASLDGNIEAKLDDGYLADVSDKGARILSIFSFQSLVRKLSLDFRDIFSEGMFYNDMKGNFTIKDGVIYTDDVVMDATAGNLKVKGNTNLVTNTLDYKMSFAPKVTSSLPIIFGVLANPLIGGAIWVFDEALQKAEVISVINFELTGTIDEPNFKEVDRKSRDVSVGKSAPDAPQEIPPQALESTTIGNGVTLGGY